LQAVEIEIPETFQVGAIIAELPELGKDIGRK
jgi:hypothetical protein